MDKPEISVLPDAIVGPDAWRARVEESIRAHIESGHMSAFPRAVSGTLATSNQLIKDPAVLQQWLSISRDILAVEMESAGVLEAAAGLGVACTVVRGISDIVGLRRDERWTQYACHSAAVFAAALIRSDLLRYDEQAIGGVWRSGDEGLGSERTGYGPSQSVCE